MIVDTCAHLGPWPHNPIGLDTPGLIKRLAPFGIRKLYAGRLEALWFENPHDSNRLPSQKVAGPVEIVNVPSLSPTVETWREELDRLSQSGPLPMVRLLPNYHGYDLKNVDPLLVELARRKIVAQVVLRFEDPRRQHPLASVPDVPMESVFEAVQRHPELTVLVSGAQTAALISLASKHPEAKNLWADTSQVDGVAAMLRILETPWAARIVFGSHAPLFEPYSALAKILLDLDDETAAPVLFGNATRLLS